MSIFLSFCILHFGFHWIFLHFAFWIPIVNFGFQLLIVLLYCVLDFGFQLSILYHTTFCILDSNCQIWIPIVKFGFQLSIFIPFCVLHFWIQELMSGKRKYTLTQVGGGRRGIVNSGYGACTFRPTFRAHFRVMNINTCHSNF